MSPDDFQRCRLSRLARQLPAGATFGLFGAALLTLGLGLGAGCSGQEEPVDEDLPAPIILISLDTLRADHTGFLGYDRDTTPFLDEIAQQSMIFERCYTTMSWTLIAHMSMLTGVYPSQHKVWTDKSVLPQSVPTLAQRLKEKGYYTMGFHFPGWLNPKYGFGRDFDVYEKHDNIEEAEEHIREALANRPKNRPYFLFVHLFDIHNGALTKKPSRLYTAPAPYDDIFMEGATDVLGETSSSYLWDQIRERPEREVHEAIVAQYDGGIRYVDDKLRAMTEEWSKNDDFDNALFIVTADHGEGLAGRQYKYRGHGDTFEEGLHVPLLIRFPDRRNKQERVPGMVSHVDIIPTVMDYLGDPKDPRLTGFSLLEGHPEEQVIFAQREKLNVLLQWPYKFVGFQKDVPSSGLIVNLEEDPLEENPIKMNTDRELFIEISRKFRKDTSDQMMTWFEPEEDAEQSASPLTDEERSALAKIGYAEGKE